MSPESRKFVCRSCKLCPFVSFLVGFDELDDKAGGRKGTSHWLQSFNFWHALSQDSSRQLFDAGCALSASYTGLANASSSSIYLALPPCCQGTSDCFSHCFCYSLCYSLCYYWGKQRVLCLAGGSSRPTTMRWRAPYLVSQHYTPRIATI